MSLRMKKKGLIRRRPLPFEFPGANWYDRREEDAVLRVVRAKSPFRYYGPQCRHEVARFEQEFGRFLGVRHVVAVNSGTQALATAMGVGPGCEVIIPAYMWISIVAGVVRLGAIPVLAEIDDSFTLDPRQLGKCITPRTRLIVVVHMSGAPADMPAIMKIARRRNLSVLEDCAQCNGGSLNGKKVGTFGTMGIFSLQLNKNMTTGEGGLVVTGSAHLFHRAEAIHDLDYPRIKGRLVLKDGPYARWGIGGRMSEISGALGRVQLRKLPGIIAAMRRAKAQIKAGIAGINGIGFRKIHDEKGDTAAFLILILPSAARAARFAEYLNKNH